MSGGGASEKSTRKRAAAVGRKPLQNSRFHSWSPPSSIAEDSYLMREVLISFLVALDGIELVAVCENL